MRSLLPLLLVFVLAACGKTDPPAPDAQASGTSASGAPTASAGTARTGTPVSLPPVTIPADAPCKADPYTDFAPAAYRPPAHVVVFIDRSSTATDTHLDSPYAAALLDELTGPMLAHGSTMDLYLLHARTTGKAQHARVSVTAVTPRLDAAQGTLATKQACDDANVAFLRSVGQAKAAADAFFQTAQPTGEDNADQSDVWGALQVVSEAAATSPAGAALRVVLLTDAMHCQNGTRCLETTPPASKQQAEAWGREDAGRARKALSLNETALARATYRFVPGTFADSPAFREVPHYWKALLGAFGVPEARVTFN